MICTHPLHKDCATCADHAVGCHADCACCAGTSELPAPAQAALLADFRSWSGGFDPWECDLAEVRAYCEDVYPNEAAFIEKVRAGGKGLTSPTLPATIEQGQEHRTPTEGQ